MTSKLTLAAAVTAMLLSTEASAARSLKLAITFDDLPVHGPTPAGETPLAIADRTIAALMAAGATNVTGFVNGRWSVSEPSSMSVLTRWHAAGLPLGNHSWSHADLSAASADQLEPEIGGNEGILRHYAGKEGWHWFRYPYLQEGTDRKRRADVRAILAKRGYRIAAVTMDFGDWAFTGPYARCVAAKDEAGISQLKTLYLQAAREGIASSRFLSKELYGRDIPYVLLMHIGALDSLMLPHLLALYRAEGFRFVSLAEAERDPVYRADVRPSLPARESTLDGRASQRGLAHPPRTDFIAKLAKICPA